MQKFNLFPRLGVILLIIIMLYACNNPNNNAKSSNETSNNALGKAQGENVVYLNGIYATSTAIPYMENAPHKVIDGTDKAWITMNGAGPDEGLMMYFDETQKIHSVKVDFVEDSKYAKIESIIVYINGSEYKLISPKDNELTIDYGDIGQLNSLYFRIREVEGIWKSDVKDEFNNNIGQMAKFDSDKAVGIKEIIFKNAGGEQLQIIAPQLVQGSVAASSILEPVEAYNPDFLFDSKLDFGWAEGNLKSDGVAEYLNFEFLNEVTIEKIKIYNGFQRSDEHFSANGRVKSFDFGTSADKATYNIQDTKEPIIIDLKQPVKGKSFNFKINDIYSGSKYKDLVVSELCFYGNNAWFTLFSGNYDKRKSELIDKVKGNILEKIINRYFYEQRNEASIREVSLLLRANQSFVIWESEGNEPDVEKSVLKVYDGNWQLLSANNTEAKVKIFGKRRIISSIYNSYKAKAPNDGTFIFSDFLTITNKTIIGEKFFNSINIKLEK